jgi:hypothetical protein
MRLISFTEEVCVSTFKRLVVTLSLLVAIVPSAFAGLTEGPSIAPSGPLLSSTAPRTELTGETVNWIVEGCKRFPVSAKELSPNVSTDIAGYSVRLYRDKNSSNSYVLYFDKGGVETTDAVPPNTTVMLLCRMSGATAKALVAVSNELSVRPDRYQGCFSQYSFTVAENAAQFQILMSPPTISTVWPDTDRSGRPSSKGMNSSLFRWLVFDVRRSDFKIVERGHLAE